MSAGVGARIAGAWDVAEWTKEEFELLKTLAAQGLSSGQITLRFNGRSRNSIISMCSRHELPLGGKPFGSQPRTKQARDSARAARKAAATRRRMKAARTIAALK